MVKIVTPATRKIYRQLIRQVNADLHKIVDVHLPPEKIDCPQCNWDATNKTSSGTSNSSFVSPVIIFGNTITPNPFTRGRCPTCVGVGYLSNPVIRFVKALVKWNPKGYNEIEQTPAGREGAPIVRLKALRNDFDTIVNAEYFIVDGVRCELNAPPTIRGLGMQEEQVIVFLLATEVGSEVKG